MPKPRRRRRFFALEGRFEVGDTGELEGIADPSQTDPAASSTVAEDEDVSFRETDAGQAGFAEASGATAESAEEALPPAFRLNRSPRARAPQKRFFSRSSLPLALACLGLGGFAGYLLAGTGRKTVTTDGPGTVQKSAMTLTSTDESELDAAYAARHAHRYEEAEQLFTTLERRHPDWGPMKVELGRTFFYENKSYDASTLLKTATEKGWKPAEANFLLGVLNKARKSYPEAELCFARAVAVDPTEPEYYFFWGECLREEGKLLDATAKFRSALLRNQYETATGLYRVKLWLCAIEADQDGAGSVNAQVDAALASPQPPMEAFVAAAARDLKTGNFGAAAAHLSRARRRADATVFRYIISDPMFVPAQSRPEFAVFFRSAPPGTNQAPDAAASSPTPSATGGEPMSPAPSQPAASPVNAKKP